MKDNFDFEDCAPTKNKSSIEINWSEIYAEYLNMIHDCADFLSEKKFGFVSKYCGDSYLERLGLFPVETFDEEFSFSNGKKKIWRSRENNKIERINLEYKKALQACNILKELNYIVKHKLSKINLINQKQLEKDFNRILKACISKGYQYPSVMLAGLVYKENIIKNSDVLLEKVLMSIEANYAKKKAYNDDGRYLKAELLFPEKKKEEGEKELNYIKRVELRDASLLSAVSSREFGEKICGQTCSSFFYKLRKVYNQVLASSKANKSVQRNIIEDEEDEKEEF